MYTGGLLNLLVGFLGSSGEFFQASLGGSQKSVLWATLGDSSWKGAWGVLEVLGVLAGLLRAFLEGLGLVSSEPSWGL